MKRGISTEGAIIAIIIFGIILIVLVILYKQLYAVASDQFTLQECQASLLLTSATDLPKFCTVVQGSPIPIHCNRDFLKVDTAVLDENKHEDITDQYTASCPAGVSSQSCLAENVIASEMAKCWHTFFEGQQTVFQQIDIREFGLTKDTDARGCFVCSEIMLSQEAKLGAYLQQAAMKDGSTYYQYLTKKARCDPTLGAPCFDTIPKQYFSTVIPDTHTQTLVPGTYAVVFIRRGLGSCEQAKGDGQDWFNGQSAISNAVEVIPADQISKVCNAVIV